DRDRVAALDAAPRQRRRKLARAHVEFGVAAPKRSVNDGGMLGEDGGRPLQEGEGAERLEVRGVAVEIDVVGRHVRPAAHSLRTVSLAINPLQAAWERRFSASARLAATEFPSPPSPRAGGSDSR